MPVPSPIKNLVAAAVDERPPTPSDFAVRQGRRSDVNLLDEEGDITDEFESALRAIFLRYASSPSSTSSPLPESDLAAAYFGDEALDRWAKDTNGAALGEEAKEEIRTFMDCDDQGNLTFRGFVQIYQLQTENDEEETWRDLAAHGFDRQLQLVSTRKEDQGVDESEPVSKRRLTGEMGGPLKDEA